ncbi:MAG: hypothetical protein ABEI27_11390 [Halobellus sp.]|uniref:DUF7285 family protein n=1 Tax=Halobellus sp. TaxID=1979212 RepID=UPI0035D3DA5A
MRAQTTPVVALIALFAVCTGVSLYATTLDSTMPTETDDALADPTLDRIHDVVSTGGVVDPVALIGASDVAPDGYRVAVAVTTERGRWTNGRRPPRGERSGVDRATRPVSVASGEGDVIWGRLTVWVWR